MAVHGLRGHHVGRQFIHVEHAAHVVQAAHSLQFFRHRQDVRRFSPVGQIQDGLENDGICFPIEIGSRQHILRRENGVFVQQHGSQYRFLRFNILRRHPGYDHGVGIRFFLPFLLGLEVFVLK